jgi:hypothetical protein
MADPSPSEDEDFDTDGDFDEDGDESEPAPSRPPLSGRAAKVAVERLDSREQLYSYIAAGGALLFGVAIYVLEKYGHVHFSKNPDAPLTTFILGVACGGLLLAATYFGRRALVGFVALFTFLVFGTTSLFLGVPFLALAVWLLHRSYKIQKETAAAARQARSGQTTPPTTRASGRTTRPSKSTGGRSAARGGKERGPAGPEANKRYTPKRPPPAAPKPSRRERKAAQASD